MESKADIGLIGLAVMGQNLVLNMNDKGFSVAVFNRTTSVVDKFISGSAANRPGIIGTDSLAALVARLASPRRVMLMVKAGTVVDDYIRQLVPLLDKGDVIIDGGNSHFPDTNRRCAELEKQGILYLGVGVSGGEEGARNGPSIMPGGNPKAWPLVQPLFQRIAARTPANQPCCEWVGEGGAGHFVKMVHNGIEYGDMQLICEAYHLMKEGLGLGYEAMQRIMGEWNRTELESYLVEITETILAHPDADGTPLVEKILDAAGQKGTGKWTVESSLDLGAPVTLIAEAVSARALSALKESRVEASRHLPGPQTAFAGDVDAFVKDLQRALLASKVVSYTQGYMLMAAAAKGYGWNLQYGDIALMWQGGCIIRSVFLGRIKEAFVATPDLSNLFLAPYFRQIMVDCQGAWRRVVAEGMRLGIPMPAFAAALSFYDGYRHARLPANLLQAQRDYFGAHTYERIDRPRGEFFHTDWSGTGGKVTSGTYNG